MQTTLHPATMETPALSMMPVLVGPAWEARPIFATTGIFVQMMHVTQPRAVSTPTILRHATTGMPVRMEIRATTEAAVLNP